MEEKDISITHALDVISEKGIFTFEELELIEIWKNSKSPSEKLTDDLNKLHPIAISIFNKLSYETK